MRYSKKKEIIKRVVILDNEDISETLRQEFKDHNISLSDDAFVTVKEKGMEWLTDGDKTYMAKKQGDKLNIY